MNRIYVLTSWFYHILIQCRALGRKHEKEQKLKRRKTLARNVSKQALTAWYTDAVNFCRTSAKSSQAIGA